MTTRATHVRSTLLQTSLRMVKLHGNYERWLDYVDPLYRATIIESVAPGWLPIEVGLAHYLACDKFGLDSATMDKIGQGAGEYLQSTLLNAAARIARSAGFTPEAVATCFSKLWPRLVQGGQLELVQLGPKELNIELRAAVLSKSPYFRGTYTGNVRAALKLLAGLRVLYLKALPYDEKQDCFKIQISYV